MRSMSKHLTYQEKHWSRFKAKFIWHFRSNRKRFHDSILISPNLHHQSLPLWKADYQRDTDSLDVPKYIIPRYFIIHFKIHHLRSKRYGGPSKKVFTWLDFPLNVNKALKHTLTLTRLIGA